MVFPSRSLRRRIDPSGGQHAGISSLLACRFGTWAGGMAPRAKVHTTARRTLVRRPRPAGGGTGIPCAGSLPGAPLSDRRRLHLRLGLRPSRSEKGKKTRKGNRSPQRHGGASAGKAGGENICQRLWDRPSPGRRLLCGKKRTAGLGKVFLAVAENGQAVFVAALRGFRRACGGAGAPGMAEAPRGRQGRGHLRCLGGAVLLSVLKGWGAANARRRRDAHCPLDIGQAGLPRRREPTASRTRLPAPHRTGAEDPLCGRGFRANTANGMGINARHSTGRAPEAANATAWLRRRSRQHRGRGLQRRTVLEPEGPASRAGLPRQHR